MSLERDNKTIALYKIKAVVEAYYNGTITITTEKNGYMNNEVGLDIIMAIIQNNVIDGIYPTIVKKGGFLYV